MKIQYMSDLHIEFSEKRYTVIGNTKIISNQMGYVFENEHLCNGFDAGKFIEL